jgi:Alcohol dehydrogenase, class IV
MKKKLGSYKFSMPRLTLVGVDALMELSGELKNMSVKKALVVTDSFMAKSDIIEKVKVTLLEGGVDMEIYGGVEPNPKLSQVKAGTYQFVESQCDMLVSLGGGSPHDCAKAIKYAVIRNEKFNVRNIPLIAINTTAGTASEITNCAVITDDETHSKVPILDSDIIPDIAVDDPMLMLKMPKGLTAATGMDALTHAIEAYVASERNDITDATAIKAIQLIDQYLYLAYTSGDNIEARNGMVYAQYLAGMAFSNAGLGLVHAMAHQLGGLYNLPHGVCNALLLPYVMAFNYKAVVEDYGFIAKQLDLCSIAQSNEFAAKALIRYVTELSQRLNIPKTLADLKVDVADCTKLAQMASQDRFLAFNPIQPAIQEIELVYKNAYYGKLEIV